MADTRQKLLEAAIQTLRTVGIAGVSARTVASIAGVNQALVFYHFGTVDELLTEACVMATKARVEAYRGRLARVTSLRELLDVGRALHVEERSLGNVAVLAQLLAGAQSEPRLAGPTAQALSLWVAQIEEVLTRLQATSPMSGIADAPGLARAISAAFVGLTLFDGVDPDGGSAALASLEQLAVLIEVMEDLGPVARRALRAKLRRRTDVSASITV